MAQVIRVALAGLGSVNSTLLKLLIQKQLRLEEEFNLSFDITAVSDSSGAAYTVNGFDPLTLLKIKETGGGIRDLQKNVAAPVNFPDVLAPSHCDLLFEATPVNLATGQPGLAYTRCALQQGVNVVLANKGPLLHHFQELTTLAKRNGCAMGYSATVCGALPVINIGQRDLVAAEIHQIRGIFNSTTNYILEQMGLGYSFQSALAEAQRQGIAETDPALDIDGWDTANKLVIIANSILNVETTLANVAVTGIGTVTTAQLKALSGQGKTIKLVAVAERVKSAYQLTVSPTVVEQSEFLGSCNGWEMGIEFHTDIYGTLYHKSWEDTPLPTAAAMLRDAINLYRN